MLGKLIVETGISKSSVDSLQGAIANAVKEGVREGLSGADFRGLLDFGEVANKFAASLNAALKTINPVDGIKIDGTGTAGDDIKQIVAELKEVKESIASINQTMSSSKIEDVMMRSAAAIGQIAARLQEVQDLVDNINNKEFSIKNVTNTFLKNSPNDDVDRFKLQINQFKQLKSVVEEVQNAYESMSSTIKEMSLDNGEMRTLNTFMQYSPKSTGGLNRTSVVAGIVEMNDLIQAAIPLIEKYNAKVDQIGQGRIPKVDIPDLANVKAAEEALEQYKSASDEARHSIEERNNAAKKQSEEAESAIKDIAQSTKEEIQKLCDEIGVLFEGLKSKIEETFSFEGPISNVSAFKERVDELSSAIAEVSSQAANIKAAPQVTAGKKLSQNIDNVDQRQLDIEWEKYYNSLREEMNRKAKNAAIAAEMYYQARDEAAEKSAQREAEADAKLTQKLIDSWKRAEDAAVESEERKAARIIQKEEDLAYKAYQLQNEADSKRRKDEEKYYTAQEELRRKELEAEEELARKELAMMDEAVAKKIKLEEDAAYKISQSQFDAESKRRYDEERYYAARDEQRQKEAEAEQEQIRKELAMMDDAVAKQESKNQREIEAALKLENQVIQLRTQYTQLAQQHEATYNAHKKDIDDYISRMQDAGSVTKEEYQEMRRQILLYHEEVKTGSEAQEIAAAKEVASEKQVAALRAKVQNYIRNNTKAYEAYGESLDSILNELSNGGKISKERLAELSAELRNIDTAARQAGISGKTFFEKLQEGWQRFGGWSIVTKSMMTFVRGSKQMIDAVKEIDSAMTELRKVTDLTTEGYRKFYDQSVNVSRNIGSTVSDTINATADFARLGFSTEDALDLANAALVYKHVGDGIESVSDASESLISTIKAFGDETYSAMQIVDMFNEVGNNFAISSTGIGEALVRSASALEGAGNTLEESIGLITAANAIIQNPDSVGTSMKTLTMYLRAAKTELEEAGESSEGCANSVSELRDELKALSGVDIMLNEDTFKSTYQIIKEISEVWDTLTDVSQANITELIGGKRNANVIQALMKNFQDAEKAMQSASNSAGSALKENEKYLDSIAGKTDLIKGKVQVLSNSIIGSGTVKYVLDLVDSVLDLANALNKVHLLLPGIATGISLVVGKGMIGDISNAVNGIISAVSTKGVDAAKVVKQFSLQTDALSVAQKRVVATSLERIAADRAINAETITQIINGLNLVETEEKVAESIGSVSLSMHEMWSVLPVWNKIALGISLVTSFVIPVIKYFSEWKNRLIEVANTAKENFDNIEKAYSSNAQSLEKLRSRFNELSHGVDENGKRIDLTEEEYEEYKSIIQQIIDISPGIVKGYNNEKEAILKYKDAINEAVEANNNFYKSGQQNYFADSDKKWQGWQLEYENALSASLNKINKTISGVFDAGIDEHFVGAIENLGIADAEKTWRVISGIAEFSLQEIEQIYEHSTEIQTLVAGALETSFDGNITQAKSQLESILQTTGNILNELEPSKAAMNEFIQRWVQWTSIISDSDRKSDWFNSYLETIPSIVNVNDDLYSSQTKAIQVLDDFKELISDVGLSDASKFKALAQSVKDGTTSFEDFEEALGSLDYLGFIFSEQAIDLAKQYFMNLAGVAEVIEESGAKVEDATYQYSELSDAISRLTSGYDILSKAMAEMDQNGGLGIDMIKTIQDALGEGEKLTDYLYEENGLIKLNTEAWEARSKALLDNNIAVAENEISGLHNKLITEGFGGELSEEDIDSINDRISELEATIEIYKAALEQGVKNDDPLNISSMLSDINTFKNGASGLITAIKEIQDGKLQDWSALTSKYPQLFDVAGLFRVDTLDGQEAALRDVLQKYDEDIDALIDNRIKLLEAERNSEGITFERVMQIDIVIENLKALKDNINLLNESSAVPVNPFEGISSAMEKASKYIDIIKDAQDGIDFDLIDKLRDTFGEKWGDYLVTDESGKATGLKVDALKAIIDEEFALYDANENIIESFDEMWAAALKGKNVKSQFEEMTDAISKVNSAMGLVKEYAENGAGHDFIDSLRSFFGEENIDDYQLYLDIAKKNGDIFYEMLLTYVDTLYTAAGATKVEIDAMHKKWAENIQDNTKVEKSYDSLSKAISDLSSVQELLFQISSGQGSKLDILNQLIELADKGGYDLSELLTIDSVSKSLKPNVQKIKAAMGDLFNITKLKQDLGLTDEIAESIHRIAVEATEAELASQALSTALSSIDTAQNIITGIETGEDSFLDTLQSVQAIADQTGKRVEDFFSIVAGKAYWDETAILDWSMEFIDNMRAIGQITPNTANEIKNLAVAQLEETIAAGKMNNVINATKDAISGFTSVSINARITYDQFKSLLDVSKDYANAIQYNNGIISLNKKKYDEVTNSVVALKKAEIEAARKSAIKEYGSLKILPKLTDAQQQRLKDLEVEIKSYKVLANEIENATSAYQRFLRTDDSVSGEQYTAAQKAADVIKNTLYNKESELYGKVGRDQYKEAVNFLIEPNVKVGTKAFDKAFKRIEKYLEEGGKGAQRFVNDMIKKGLLDPTSGKINTTLEEIAKKMGVSVDFVRAEIEELNSYGSHIKVAETVDVNTNGIEKAYKRIERYMEKGTEGIKNFFDDMVDKGIVDPVTQEIDLTVEEIAKKMGVSQDLVQSMIDGLNSYGGDVKVKPSVEPEMDKEKEDEAKKSMSDIIKSAEDATTLVDELSKKQIDIDATPAAEKFDAIDQEMDNVLWGIINIGETPLSINTTPALDSLGKVSSGLSKIIADLNKIISRGLIKVNIVETTHRYTVDHTTSNNTTSSGGYSVASGSHGVPGGRTLVGEKGREIVVDPTNNHWYTVGDKGAEFVSLPKGALVFNAEETDRLLRDGGISDRAGMAMASGTSTAYHVIRKGDGNYVIFHGSLSGANQYAKNNNGSVLATVNSKSDAQKRAKYYKDKDTAKTSSNKSNNTQTNSVKPAASVWYSVIRKGNGGYVIYYGTVDQANQYARQNSGSVLCSVANKSDAQKRAKYYIEQDNAKKNANKTKTTGSPYTPVNGSVKTNIPISSVSSAGGNISSDSGDYNAGGEPDTPDPLDEILAQYRELNDQLEHAIEHQKYLYDVANRAVDYNGMGRSLSEQARIYQQEMENAQKGISDLMAQGADDTDERLQQLEETYWNAHRNLYSIYDSINSLYVDGLNDKIDSVQSAYDTLSQIADQFNNTGAIDVDQFQQLVSNGLQYLNYLEKVDGQYVLNQEAIDNLVKAEKKQLAVETALSYLNRVLEAAEAGSIEKLRELANETQNISSDNWFGVYTMLNAIESSGKVSDDLMAIIRQNIRKFEEMSDAVVSGLGGVDGIANDIQKKIERLNDYLDHTIQHQLYLYDVANRAGNFDGMADSLQRQAEIYKQQMDNAQQGIDQLLGQGIQDTDARMQQMEDLYWTAHRNLYSTFDKINALYVDGLNDKIDSVQNAYDTIQEIADQYNGAGEISVDQFQQLLDNGIQYLSYLDLVDGKYQLNKEAVEELVAAEKERLAIESALAYLSRASEAADAGNLETLRELANETQNVSTNRWAAVVNMLDALEESGKVPEELMVVIRQNVQKLQSLSGNVVMNAQDASELAEKIRRGLEEQESALDRIVDLTEDMIKQEVNDHIEAIQKEVNLFKEIIDLKKKSLDKTREEDSYQRNVNDKLKEISTIQSRMEMLSLDDSRSAQAEKASLAEKLANLQMDLADTQSEHSYQVQVDALDKMAEDYEKSREKEIKALEDSISSAEKLYQQAIDRISSSWNSLYQDLVNWNIESGSVLTSEITDNWRIALSAAQEYGGYVQAMRGIHQKLESYDNANSTLKYRVEDLPRYHGGGVVNNDGEINDNEVLAILKKGEVVLDKDQKKSLYSLLNLKEYLSQKLGKTIGDVAGPAKDIQSSAFATSRNIPVATNYSNNQSVDFRPEINVNISHNGNLDQTTAKAYGEKAADIVLDKLYGAFERRGAGNIFSGKFKG